MPMPLSAIAHAADNRCRKLTFYPSHIFEPFLLVNDDELGMLTLLHMMFCIQEIGAFTVSLSS
jgi:hypothetical protein